MGLLRAKGYGKGMEAPPLLCARQRRKPPPLLARQQSKPGPLQLADLPEALLLPPLGFQREVPAPLLLAQLQGLQQLPQQQSSVLLMR